MNLEGTRQIRMRGQSDQGVNGAFGDLTLPFVRALRGRDQHGHAARFQSAIKGDDELGDIRQQDGDPIAQIKTRGTEGMGEAIDLSIQLPVSVVLCPFFIWGFSGAVRGPWAPRTAPERFFSPPPHGLLSRREGGEKGEGPWPSRLASVPQIPSL